MKNKLRKKGKNNQIVFPSYFLGKNIDPSNENVDAMDYCESSHHRTLKRDLSSDNKQKKSRRSLSLKMFDTNAQKKNNCFPLKQGERQKSKTKSVLKKKKRTSSSIQIAKIYYKEMEKGLSKFCEAIILQQRPEKQHEYNIQHLSKNLMVIKQKQPAKLQKKVMPKQLTKFVFVDTNEISLASQKSNTQNQNEFLSEKKINQTSTLLNGSAINIMMSGNTIQSEQNQTYLQNRHHRILHHNSLLISKNSCENSLFKVQKNISYGYADSFQRPVYFFLPKFCNSYTTYTKIQSLKIQFIEQKQFKIQIYFRLYSEIIFKKLYFTINHQRRNNTRSKISNIKRPFIIRQKLVSNVLACLAKPGRQQMPIDFYQDLIIYFEYYLMLEKTYRGLNFIDTEQQQYQQRIFQSFTNNKQFHFILKLNNTFYLAKVINTPSLLGDYQIKFTILYDFTTHNIGNKHIQIYPSLSKFKDSNNKFHINKFFKKIIKQYVDEKWNEWNNELRTHKEIQQKNNCAKITQVTSASIEKWDAQQVYMMNDINKQYEMVGDLKNYFVYHDHFDYGFLNSDQHVLRIDNCSYCLDQINVTVPVYTYPSKYTFLKLSQMQAEALLIPHTSDKLHPKFSRECIQNILRISINRKQKIDHQTFILFINKKMIRLRQKSLRLQIFVQSNNNIRCNKITVPIREFPSYDEEQQDLLNLNKASLYIKDFLQLYQREKSYLYDKLLRHGEPRVIIYYKGVQKIEGHFAFITLYGLPKHNIYEFKINMIKFGREFIVRLESIDLSQPNSKKNIIHNILELVKNTFFKNLIIEEAKLNRKRKQDALNQFFKRTGNSIQLTNIRSKKKVIDINIKKRGRRIVTYSNSKDLVYENIITNYYKPKAQKQFFITLRYEPTQELKELKQWRSERVQICVYKEGMFCHFRQIIALADLIRSVSQGMLKIEQIDLKNTYLFFKEVNKRIKMIIKSSYWSMNLTINKLRHFLIPNYQPHKSPKLEHRYKFIEQTLFQIEQKVVEQSSIKSSISITLQSSKKQSSNSIGYSYPMITQVDEFIQPLSFQFKYGHPINYHLLIDIDIQNYFQIINIVKLSEDQRFLRQYRLMKRELWINNRQESQRIILSEWDLDFLSSISFAKYNKRMFRRLIKVLKRVL